MNKSQVDKPFPLRLGLLKPFLQRMAHDDSNCKGLTDFIQQRLQEVVIADPIEGSKYQLQLKIFKQLKASKENVVQDEKVGFKGIAYLDKK